MRFNYLAIAAIVLLAFSANVLGETTFPESKLATTVSRQMSNIPPSVLDPNFRWWTPPIQVQIVPAAINDLMMTDGVRIYYNPYVVQSMPLKLQAFILAHEYGHIVQRTSHEPSCDAFAARMYADVDRSVVRSAIWFFHNVRGRDCNATHGCGWQRAQHIAQSAGFSRAEFEQAIYGNF